MNRVRFPHKVQEIELRLFASDGPEANPRFIQSWEEKSGIINMKQTVRQEKRDQNRGPEVWFLKVSFPLSGVLQPGPWVGEEYSEPIWTWGPPRILSRRVIGTLAFFWTLGTQLLILSCEPSPTCIWPRVLNKYLVNDMDLLLIVKYKNAFV